MIAFVSRNLPLFPLQYFLDAAKRSMSEYNESVWHAMMNASGAKIAFDAAAAAFEVGLGDVFFRLPVVPL